MSSCLTRFLEDPWSSLKVVVPTVAIEVILHKKVWEKASLRELTLGLTVVNVYWFATTSNISLFETPLLTQVPTLDDRQKADNARHRYNWLNKLELIVGVVGLDLYCEWRKRILDHDGFVDIFLSQAVLAPVAITALQSAYLLPKLTECAKDKAENKVSACTTQQNCLPHKAYCGLEAVKVIGTAVAGIRFGRMLTL